MHRPHSHDSEPLASRRRALRQRFVDIVQAGRDVGAYAVRDVELAADLLADVLHAAGDRASANPGEAERVVEATSSFVRGALLQEALPQKDVRRS